MGRVRDQHLQTIASMLGASLDSRLPHLDGIANPEAIMANYT
jgi:hypothetical protein